MALGREEGSWSEYWEVKPPSSMSKETLPSFLERVTARSTRAEVPLGHSSVVSFSRPRAAASEVATMTGPSVGSSVRRELVSMTTPLLRATRAMRSTSVPQPPMK